MKRVKLAHPAFVQGMGLMERGIVPRPWPEKVALPKGAEEVEVEENDETGEITEKIPNTFSEMAAADKSQDPQTVDKKTTLSEMAKKGK